MLELNEYGTIVNLENGKKSDIDDTSFKISDYYFAENKDV